MPKKEDCSSNSPEQPEIIRGRDKHLLLGITGGIATGKSTVVGMLRQKGAPVIDFDILARKVVEPGQPAWKDIAAYFGEQVLQNDRALDRKRLSELVFRDVEKRKKLEYFTHPRIRLEFIKELEDILSKDPNAIVTVDIPLMFEFNLQYMFHKTVVVYVPEQLQIKRLMKRDGISREEAANIIKAQIPIEKKVDHAHYVISNERGLAETQSQVDELWPKLRLIQQKNNGA